MHLVLVGPGALGCLLSCLLSDGLGAGDKVTIVDHNHPRATLLNSKGITYQFDYTTKKVAVQAVADPAQLTDIDVVLLCVKSYDVASSLQFCQPVFHHGTLLVFMQNGIAHLDQPPPKPGVATAYGTTTEGATLLGQGHVRHAGRGRTYLGFIDQPSSQASSRLRHLASIFNRGGMTAEVTDNIRSRLWAKLFINVAINGLTATLGCKNGELLHLPGVKRRMEAAVNEAILVARTQGVEIMSDPHLAVRIVCEKTADNISSMLQDMRNRKPTEIDAINGAIVAMGRRFGIATPENDLLVEQVKALEAQNVTR